MRIATWNVNSVRARMPLVAEFLERAQPDVLCMQETKVVDDDFPAEAFTALGFAGEKSYNGVAIAGRLPLTVLQRGFEDDPADAPRLLVARVGRLPVVNTYVPQGKAADDPAFRYKLEWMARLRDLFGRISTPRSRLLWVGDMNVAPEERDVYDPKALRQHPDFHPEARAALADTMAWGFVDCFRQHNDEGAQYTFFESVEKGHGWRVDHILATRSLARLCTGSWIDMAPRLADRPSDHTPLLAEFDL